MTWTTDAMETGGNFAAHSAPFEAKKNQGEREMGGPHVGCEYFDGTGKKFLIFWHLMNFLSERVCTTGKKSSGCICA